MAAAGVEEDLAIQAARILLTLRNRKLLRCPEWVQKEPAATAVAVAPWSLGAWPKKKRSGQRLQGCWQAAMALPKLCHAVACSSSSAFAGSGPSLSSEERERSPAPQHRWREMPPSRNETMAAARRPVSPAHCSALAGSGPSTSTDLKVRPRHAVETAAKATAAASVVSTSAKEPMKAASPETPLEFVTVTAAGSGASSSGDDAARSPSKRKADGSGGRSASSGDEGCSSPAKRARVSAGDDGEKAISEPKMQHAPDDKAVKHGFDLNMLPEDDECSGFC